MTQTGLDVLVCSSLKIPPEKYCSMLFAYDGSSVETPQLHLNPSHSTYRLVSFCAIEKLGSIGRSLSGRKLYRNGFSTRPISTLSQCFHNRTYEVLFNSLLSADRNSIIKRDHRRNSSPNYVLSEPSQAKHKSLPGRTGYINAITQI